MARSIYPAALSSDVLSVDKGLQLFRELALRLDTLLVDYDHDIHMDKVGLRLHLSTRDGQLHCTRMLSWEMIQLSNINSLTSMLDRMLEEFDRVDRR